MREDDFQILLRIAKSLLQIEQRHRGFLGRRGLGQVIQANSRPLDPFAIGLGRGQLALELIVINDATLFNIHQEHFSRLQTPLLDNFRFREIKYAGFRCQHNDVVVGEDISCRSQAVAIQRRANLPAIGESHGSRAVPRLHQGCVVLIKRAAIFIHQFMAAPRLWNHHHHGVRQRVSAHHQHFQAIVEAGRI